MAASSNPPKEDDAGIASGSFASLPFVLNVRQKRPLLFAFLNEALTVISPVTSLSSSERNGTVATISLPNDGSEDGYIVHTPMRSSALARSNTPM